MRRIEKIETAIEPHFQHHFVEAMAIPHKTASYPNLRKVARLAAPEGGRRDDTAQATIGERGRIRTRRRAAIPPARFLGRGSAPRRGSSGTAERGLGVAPSTCESCQPKMGGSRRTSRRGDRALPHRERPPRANSAAARGSCRRRAGYAPRTGAPWSGCRQCVVARVLDGVDHVVADGPAERREVDQREARARGAEDPTSPSAHPRRRRRPSTACGQEVTRFISG